MYISRSDWREFVERLDAAERKARENYTLVVAYQHELDEARAKVLVLVERVASCQGKYDDLRTDLHMLLDQS